MECSIPVALLDWLTIGIIGVLITVALFVLDVVYINIIFNKFINLFN
jgi:hypothetical protein